MTDQRSPLDAALDLMLFAPVGLALTIGEELPKLAAKGRSTVTARVTTARIVGQFAVTQGRRELERRMRPPTPPTPAAAPRPASDAGSAASESHRATTQAPAAASGQTSPTTATGGGTETALAEPATHAPHSTNGNGNGNGSAPAKAPAAAAPPVRADDLAIPSYDALSASQVVARLAGLSHDELDAVKRYEAATRGRRTILARISQLQG